jgi:uncharacterized membrane protein
MVADGLKSFAEGMELIAGKVDALAKSLGDTEPKPEAPKQKAAKARPQKAEKKTVKKPAATAPVKRPAVKAVVKAAPEGKEALTASATVLEVISDSGNGIDPGGIMEKTGFDKKKVSNILHRLKQQGKIENAKRGMYSKKR